MLNTRARPVEVSSILAPQTPGSMLVEMNR